MSGRMVGTTHQVPCLRITLTLVTALLGCEEKSAATALPSPPDHTYTTRGRLAHVTRSPNQPPALAIHHEAIDDFVSREGDVVGMKAMTMQFAVAKDVSLDRWKEGDVAEFTFEVRWKGDPMLTVTALRKLPAATELRLEAAAHKTEHTH